jgi:putative tryptophan/tyrosine transport system substrate-binding protein
MRRRDFISLIGSAAAAWPLAVLAQQAAKPVIGWLNVASKEDYARPLSAFLDGLGEVGYVDGRNVSIEYRWAEHHEDRLPALVTDLIHRGVAIIAATSTPAALAAKAATNTIPIIFETAADPVRLGLVASLNRPGGNVTGITQLTVGMVPKELELLHELVPTAHAIALLVNPSDPALAETEAREAESAVHTLGLELHVLNASTEHDFESVFASLKQLPAGGLVIGTDVLFTSHSEQLAALATHYAVPAIYKGREFAAAGGLISYGSDITHAYHLAGVYSGRILKGERPSDLPVQQATKVEMYINLKTARALGITIPLPLSGRADEVFE